MNDLIQEIENYNWNKYYELQTIINNYIRKHQEKNMEISNEVLSEYLAFSLHPNVNWLSNWGTYFWPYAIFNNWDWTSTENPWRSYLTENVLTYWKNRSIKSKNLFLKIRYLDLIYDLNEMITWKELDFSIKTNFIESWILWVKHGVLTSLDGKFFLKRLLDVSIALSQKKKTNELVDLIISYEDQISEDNKPWLWGFSYDYLLENKKVKLSKENESKIINTLELKLNNFQDIYLIKHVGNRLTRYYKLKNDFINLLRVLLKIKEISYIFIERNNDWLTVSNYFHELINLFTIYQDNYNIKSEKDQILNDFQRKMKNTNFDFKEVSTSHKITDKEMNDYIDSFFNDSDKIIPKICVNYVISIKRTKKLLDELVKNYPLSYMINRRTIDDKWFVINNTLPINDDYEGNLYEQLRQDLHIGSIFIDRVLSNFTKVFQVKDLLKEFTKDTIFNQKDEVLLKTILRKYYKWDYLEFNFLVIPFLEKSFRTLNETLWYTVINFRDNKTEYVSLDKLICSWLIKNIFKTRWDDFELYFRLILTKVEWWNLRNNLAHWIELDFFHSKKVSDRLFHILLCFIIIKVLPK